VLVLLTSTNSWGNAAGAAIILITPPVAATRILSEELPVCRLPSDKVKDELVPMTVASVKFPPNWTFPLRVFNPLSDVARTFTPALVTPLTVLVKAPFEIAIEWELMIFTDEPVTPLTEVVKVFAALVLLTEFTAAVFADTPFTTEVMVLALLLIVCVVVAGAALVGVQADPFQLNTCPLPGAVAETEFPCSRLAFQ